MSKDRNRRSFNYIVYIIAITVAMWAQNRQDRADQTAKRMWLPLDVSCGVLLTDQNSLGLPKFGPLI